MSGISKNAQPTPAPDRLDPNWYPKETWSAFLLLVFILMGGCITTPFLFFLNVVTPGSSSAELARYAASLHAGRFASVASFILLAGVIFYFDLRRLHKHFTTSTLKDKDPSFYSKIQLRCQGVRWDQVELYVGNPADTNAMTFGIPGRFAIVLGGGLRLLFRRDPASAMVIVEHEIGHLQNRDVTIALVSRALVRSYVGLSIGSMLYAAVIFAKLWLQLAPGYIANKELLSVGILGSVVPLVTNLLQYLPFAALAWVIYRRLLQVREYYADSRVRDKHALQAVLGRAVAAEHQSVAVRIRRFVSTHPRCEARLKRVSDVRLWSRYDWPYMFLLGFLGGLSLSELVAMPWGVREPFASDVPGIFQSMVDSTSAILELISAVALQLTICWGIVAHCTRVSTIQIQLNRGILKRAAAGAWVATTMAVATYVQLVSWPYLTMIFVIGGRRWVPPLPGIGISVSVGFILLAGLIPLVTFGAWLNRRWPARRCSKLLMVIVPFAGSSVVYLCIIALLKLTNVGSGIQVNSLSPLGLLGLLFYIRDIGSWPGILSGLAGWVAIPGAGIWIAFRIARLQWERHSGGGSLAS